MMTWTYESDRIKATVESDSGSLEGILDDFRRFLVIAGQSIDHNEVLELYNPETERIIDEVSLGALHRQIDDLIDERDELRRELDTIIPGELDTKTDPTWVSDWVEWHGGERPVPADTRVDVKFRAGGIRNDYPADEWTWLWLTNSMGNPMMSNYDIIAYRVVEKEA